MANSQSEDGGLQGDDSLVARAPAARRKKRCPHNCATGEYAQHPILDSTFLFVQPLTVRLCVTPRAPFLDSETVLNENLWLMTVMLKLKLRRRSNYFVAEIFRFFEHFNSKNIDF